MPFTKAEVRDHGLKKVGDQCFRLFPVNNEKAAYKKAHTRLFLPGGFQFLVRVFKNDQRTDKVPQDFLVVAPAKTTGSSVLASSSEDGCVPHCASTQGARLASCKVCSIT